MVARHHQQGYVLITVLVALVLLALVAARLDSRVEGFREGVGNWQRWAETQTSLASARDELLFALTTRTLSPWGFGQDRKGAVRVDGRPYRLSSGVLVSVQDMRGLISVSTPDPVVLRNFLLANGVTDRDIEPLLDKLADYNDTDSLKRLNGAEKKEYLAAGMAPPRNDWPISAYEVKLIMGWANLPQIYTQAGDIFTASRESWINTNTAPPAVLATLTGATRDGVATLLKLREERPLTSAADLLAVSGILVSDEPASFHPGPFFRIRLWREDGFGAMEYALILTPGGIRLPWQILEVRLVDRPRRDEGKEIAPFPFGLSPTTDTSR
jgi:type II secretory pathway component PulK